MAKRAHQLRVDVLLSGGWDSSCCVAYYLERNALVSGTFVDYGQPAAQREHLASRKIGKFFDISVRRLKVSPVAVSKGEIVGRNAMLLSLSLFAARYVEGLVAIGVHSGSGYGDCSPPFIRLMQQLFDVATAGTFRVDAPFLLWTKPEVVAYGAARIPGHLTYSCERGGNIPCGDCRSCKDRKAYAC